MLNEVTGRWMALAGYINHIKLASRKIMYFLVLYKTFEKSVTELSGFAQHIYFEMNEVDNATKIER